MESARKSLFNVYYKFISRNKNPKKPLKWEGKTIKFIDDFLGLYKNEAGANAVFTWFQGNNIPLSDGTNFLTRDEYKKIYCCDLEWAKSKSYCKTDFTADGWDSCVNNTNGTKNNDGTITYDSNTAGGKVTLNKDHTFKSSITGWESGTWSCTSSGKVLLNNAKVTPPSPAPPGPNPNPSPAACPTTTATGADIISGTLIKKCVKGDIVGEIQKHLKKHGFGNFSKDGTIDKTFGSRTKQMVIDFQNSKGLKPDGIVGPKTWVELVKDKTTTTVVPPKPVTPVTPIITGPISGGKDNMEIDF